MAITYIQNKTTRLLTIKGVDGENYLVQPKVRKTYIPCAIDESCKKMIGKEIIILKE